MITEDLSLFFEEFAEDAIFGGQVEAVRVIFNAPAATLPDGGLGMADNRPSVLIRSSDVPCDASEDDADLEITLTDAETLRPGFPTDYLVSEVQPDGTGMSTLILRAAP